MNPELDSAIQVREIDRGIARYDDRVAFDKCVIGIEQCRGNLLEVHQDEACVGRLLAQHASSEVSRFAGSSKRSAKRRGGEGYRSNSDQRDP
jgi:hypothetical protein